MEDEITLGGNIQLSGFKEVDGGSMVILRKIVGNYARKFSDRSNTFESLSLRLKTVHQTEASQKHEIHAKLIDNGKPYTAEVLERNLFVAVDSGLKKVDSLAK